MDDKARAKAHMEGRSPEPLDPFTPNENVAASTKALEEPGLSSASESVQLRDLAQLATLTPAVLGGLVSVLNDHGEGLAFLRVEYDLENRYVEFIAEVCDCEEEDEEGAG